ncbi:helix-turn-helix transcriptional regulator [Candidatus Saccharibacteria bacterium]|nr:helix-turn-helix transcriptional regulator [Candidatus Saccharibacteria bacterium]
MSSYGIRWNDDLDIEAETIYQDGELVRTTKLPINFEIAYMVSSARAKSGLSQAKLSELTGIDQADISKIENGLSNPSISTLERIAKALRADLEISIK